MTVAVSEGWLEELKDLLAELARGDVVEFELVQDGTRIYLRRDECAPRSAGTVATALPPAPRPAPPAHNGHVPITTPLTGVFYLASSPGAPAYVNPGDLVEIGQVIGLVEAMKAFNEIRAESRGKVASILAKNGELVQKGQVLLQLQKE